MYEDRGDAPYSAKVAYRDPSVAVHYERDRYRRALGRYTHWREQKVVRRLLERLPEGITVLDCPCGTGRWWPILRSKASSITGVDISEGMLAYARERADIDKSGITLVRGDAESLPLDDNSVDYVFSHALMKHLPIPVQALVLSEFARVSRNGVLCSFSIVTHLSYEVWRHRDLFESFPILREQLAWLASDAGLTISGVERCTTPVGVERLVLLVPEGVTAHADLDTGAGSPSDFPRKNAPS